MNIEEEERLKILSNFVLCMCVSRNCIAAKKNDGNLVSDKDHPGEEYYCFFGHDPRVTFKEGCTSAVKMINKERTPGTMTVDDFIVRKTVPAEELFDLTHQNIPILDFKNTTAFFQKKS